MFLFDFAYNYAVCLGVEFTGCYFRSFIAAAILRAAMIDFRASGSGWVSILSLSWARMISSCAMISLVSIL